MSIIHLVFALLSLIACTHMVKANYRTCMCDIRTEDEANAPVLTSWSDRLRSCGLFCGFPGVHVSCDEVKSWCPNNCFSKAKAKIQSNAELDNMCKRHGKMVSPPNGIHMFAYSKVMNNCGAAWNHHNLNTKLCCFVLRPQNRWIGYKC
eukprot:gene16753-8212_t